MTLRLDLPILLVVDVQERLAPAMHPELYGPLVENLRRFGAARSVLDLPVIATEQYPKGLGPTVEPVRGAFEGVVALEKMTFSAFADDAIRQAIEASGRRTVIVSGMETHICVYQTARDLAGAGYGVHVLADAVASRSRQSYEVGLDLIQRAGAVVTTTETVLFDRIGRAGTDAFKLVSKLVR
jgi:nicotinamidase-related amidase